MPQKRVTKPATGSSSDCWRFFFCLSWEAATTLAAPLVHAKNGDIQALSSLGITREDMISMSEGKNPSAQTLTTLSEKLSLSLGETHTLIQQMKADVQTALAAQ